MSERRELDRRGEDQIQIEKTRPTWSMVATIIMIIATALVTYEAANNTADKRISVLETKQDNTQERLNEINGQLGRLNSKMDQVLMNSNRDRTPR